MFEEIYEIMDKIYLKENLIVQRLGALRISKQKEELVSDCLRRILDAYLETEWKTRGQKQSKNGGYKKVTHVWFILQKMGQSLVCIPFNSFKDKSSPMSRFLG